MEKNEEINAASNSSLLTRLKVALIEKEKHLPGFLRKDYSITVLIILLLGFVAIAVFFAFRIKTGGVPDEGYHFPVSKFYSYTWGIPANTTETYPYSYMDHKPFMSYWINGRALNVLHLVYPAVSNWQELIFLRLLCVIYSLGTILFSFLLAREVIENKWGQVIAVFFLMTTLMFVFMSGGVSYDSLTNLSSIAGIFFFTRSVKGIDFYKNSLLWLLWISFGALVKVTVLPLAAILTILWGLYILKNREKIKFYNKLNLRLGVMLVVFALLVLANISIYGVDIIKFGNLKPSCSQVLTEEQCMQNVIFARNTHLDSKGSLTLNDIIKGKGPDPILYFSRFWFPAMLRMIFGITGNLSFFPSDFTIGIYRIILLISLLSLIRYWKTPSFSLTALCVIFGFYVIVVFITNYRTEMRFLFKHFGVQGRYLFPIVGLAYTLFAKSILDIHPAFLRWLVLILVLALFLSTFLGVLLPNISSLVVQ